MPVMRTVLGLDLGAHSLKAVELAQTLRGIELVQMCSLRRTEDDAATPLPELLRHFAERHRLATDHVVTCLPGDRLSSRRLTFPFREKRRLAQAVPFAVEEQLPFDLEDVVVDWVATGGDRDRADVLAAIAPRSEVSSLLEVLDAAGCAPRVLEAEGLALGNLGSVFDLPGRRLLVDLGERKTTLCLLLDGAAVAARTVPVAGRHLTEALAGDRGLAPGDAERTKCEEGVFLAGLEAPPQTTKVLDRIAREIARTLGAVEGLLGGQPPDAITLLGGTALLSRLDEYLGERLGVPVARLGLPREEYRQLVAGGDPVLFAPAIALALRGTAQAKTSMNFRRDEFALRLDLGRLLRNFRWTGWLAAAALLLAAVNLVTSATLESRRARALEQQIAALYADAFPSAPLPANPISALREQVVAAQDRADFLGVYRGNLSALDLLEEISRRVPPDLDIALEELSIDRQTVRMRVQAKSFEAADRLGVELAKFPPFARASIGAIETDSRTGAKRFTVTISLSPPEEKG
jgi:type IV pilus assembly protein PilM